MLTCPDFPTFCLTPWIYGGLLVSCLCLVVPAWNALSRLACLIKLCLLFQTPEVMSLGNVTERGCSPHPAASCLHVHPRYPGHPFSATVLILWWFVSSNLKAGTCCLSFFPKPNVVAGTQHAVNIMIWQAIWLYAVFMKSDQMAAFILRNTPTIEEVGLLLLQNILSIEALMTLRYIGGVSRTLKTILKM